MSTKEIFEMECDLLVCKMRRDLEDIRKSLCNNITSNIAEIDKIDMILISLNGECDCESDNSRK